MAPHREDPARHHARRPYRRPTVVDYGSVRARTLSATQTGSFFDVMQGKLSKKL